MNGLLSPTDNAGDRVNENFCPLVTPSNSLSLGSTLTFFDLEETKGELKLPKSEMKEVRRGLSNGGGPSMMSLPNSHTEKYQVRILGPVEEQSLNEDNEDYDETESSH